MIHKQWQLSDDRLQVDIHEVNSEFEHVRDLEPGMITLRWDQLKVVEVKVELDSLMATEIEIIVVVGDPFNSRDNPGSLHMHTWSITEDGKRRLGE